MKKILLLALSIVTLLFNSAITSASSCGSKIGYTLSTNQNQEYTFVGRFFFVAKTHHMIVKELSVYEKSYVINGKVVSSYYAYCEGKYYKLIPCNYTHDWATYNYYISMPAQWYAKIDF